MIDKARASIWISLLEVVMWAGLGAGSIKIYFLVLGLRFLGRP